MKIVTTPLTGFWDAYRIFGDTMLEMSGRAAVGDGVVDMFARSFCALVASVSMGIAANCAVADETKVALLEPGGSLRFDAPGNLSHSVYIDLRNVEDRQGQVASFRLNAYRNGEIVESQRVTVLEPGGEIRRFFRRPFHTLEILDAEGNVSGTVKAIGFCSMQMVGDFTCRVKGGGAPTPLEMVTAPMSSSSIANQNSGGDPGGSTGVPDVLEGNVGDDQGDEGDADDKDTEMAQRQEGMPFHGENQPISRLTRIAVQAGPGAMGSYNTMMPWLDQAKLAKSWSYNFKTSEEKTEAQVALNDQQMPVMPAGHNGDLGYNMDAGAIWFGSVKEGSHDIAGSWLMSATSGVELAPRLYDVDVTRETAEEVRFTCRTNSACRLMLRISESPEGAAAPTLIQLTDAAGRSLSDVGDHANGLVTRSRWRKALFGYTDLRLMHYSGATAPSSMPIRFDHFPDLDDASWTNQGFFVPFRTNSKKAAKEGLADLKTGMGMQKVFTPIEARLRAAHELGAVYHHNFPHLFLEHKNDVDPVMVGQWAIDLFARDDLTEAQKRSLFNDYELQHVDEFGALVASNQDLITNNQVKVEIGNEVWNFGWPYLFGNEYFSRKAEASMKELGWGELPGVSKNAVQLGYDVTKTVARLRKKYPQIEWRGVMATHTADRGDSRNNSNPAPQTPSGYYNRFFHGMMTGYDLFWLDYARNEGAWSELYASKPVCPGDWFEAQGTTYFRFEAKRADMKTHIAGIGPSELEERTRNAEDWPALRQEILAWFMDYRSGAGEVSGPRGQKSGTSDLAQMAWNFVALADHAEALGMQVTSYEGGSHARLGSYWEKQQNVAPNVLAFWRNFHDSVENALIQAAVHDAAISAGWMGLSDFSLFEAKTESSFLFGTRKGFADLTPRYCEYARWMPRDKELPSGMTVEDVDHPHVRCGGLIDYLNQARANGYYVGQEVPEPGDIMN